MKRVECRTIAEFEAAIKAGDYAVVFGLRVEAPPGSEVEAWGNSTVTARGNAIVRLFRALAVIASAHVVVMIHGPAQKLEGGVHVQALKPVLGREWCEFFGLDPATSNLKVENIDAAILGAIESGKGQLDMGSWHGDEEVTEENWCGTTHCRAGYAICLAGKPGFALERELNNSEAAGQMIYAVSRPDEPLPDFYAGNDETMDDLRAHAAKQMGGA